MCQSKNIFQYVYSCVYPGVYCSTERRGFDLKSTFQLVFKAYKDQKKKKKKRLNNHLEKTRKITWLRDMNRLSTRKKPIKMDYFHNEEKKITKEQIEKQKNKPKTWQEVAEKNKVLKNKKKKRRKKKLKELSYGNG